VGERYDEIGEYSKGGRSEESVAVDESTLNIGFASRDVFLHMSISRDRPTCFFHQHRLPTERIVRSI